MKLYCPGSDGDRPLQTPEDPAPEQRPHLLLPVPNPERTQVHPFCQRSSQRPQTLELTAQHDLRSQGTPPLSSVLKTDDLENTQAQQQCDSLGHKAATGFVMLLHVVLGCVF